jgi:hypothetical protein
MKFMTKEELYNLLVKRWWWIGIIIGLAVTCVAVSIAAIVLGYEGYTGVSQFNQPTYVYTSQPFPSTPYVFYIESSGAAVTLTLPNDLTEYIGNTYRIYSNTAQMHVVQLTTPGATFDGATTIATFGGNIRDGFEFEVTGTTIANVKFIKNVVFS